MHRLNAAAAAAAALLPLLALVLLPSVAHAGSTYMSDLTWVLDPPDRNRPDGTPGAPGGVVFGGLGDCGDVGRGLSIIAGPAEAFYNFAEVSAGLIWLPWQGVPRPDASQVPCALRPRRLAPAEVPRPSPVPSHATLSPELPPGGGLPVAAVVGRAHGLAPRVRGPRHRLAVVRASAAAAQSVPILAAGSGSLELCQPDASEGRERSRPSPMTHFAARFAGRAPARRRC